MTARAHPRQAKPLPASFMAAFGSLAAQLDSAQPDAEAASFTWNKWIVVPRGMDPAEPTGFNVSRESLACDRIEFLLNEVRKPKIFRSKEKAQSACDAANERDTVAHPSRRGDSLHWPDGRITDLNGIRQPQFVGGAA